LWWGGSEIAWVVHPTPKWRKGRLGGAMDKGKPPGEELLQVKLVIEKRSKRERTINASLTRGIFMYGRNSRYAKNSHPAEP